MITSQLLDKKVKSLRQEHANVRANMFHKDHTDCYGNGPDSGLAWISYCSWCHWNQSIVKTQLNIKLT